MKRIFDGLRDLFSLFFSNKKDSSDYVKVEGDSFKKEQRMKDKYLITRFLSLYLFDMVFSFYLDFLLILFLGQ